VRRLPETLVRSQDGDGSTSRGAARWLISRCGRATVVSSRIRIVEAPSLWVGLLVVGKIPARVGRFLVGNLRW
jgi:hypothetical protein